MFQGSQTQIGMTVLTRVVDLVRFDPRRFDPVRFDPRVSLTYMESISNFPQYIMIIRRKRNVQIPYKV